MDTLFPTMLERPKRKILVNTYIYWLFGFWFVPFMMKGLLMDAWDNMPQRAVFETISYGIHFAAAVLLFRRYLANSFFMAKVYTKQILKTAAICIGLMCVLAGGVFLVGVALQSDLLMLALRGMLPVPVNETVMLSGDLLFHSPLLGSITMVILAPVSVCCLLYAPCFSVACSKHPIGAYGITAVVLFLPRVLNVTNFQPFVQEVPLYLAQLPLHLIACWGYQKTDCIWTPIFSVTCVNILTCAALVLIRTFMM